MFILVIKHFGCKSLCKLLYSKHFIPLHICTSNQIQLQFLYLHICYVHDISICYTVLFALFLALCCLSKKKTTLYRMKTKQMKNAYYTDYNGSAIILWKRMLWIFMFSFGYFFFHRIITCLINNSTCFLQIILFLLFFL